MSDASMTKSAASASDEPQLRRTIGPAQMEGPASAIVAATADYAAAVEFGSSPHEIRPSEAKALWWPGAAHPG